MPDFYPGDLDPCTPLPEFRDGLPADTSGRRTLLYEVRGGCMG
jgi:hypothetical protein